MKALKIFRAIWLAILLLSAVFVITCVIMKWDIIPVMSSGYDAKIGSLLLNNSAGFRLLEIPLLGFAAYYCWTLVGKIVIGVITALLIVSFFLDDKFDKKKKVEEEVIETVPEDVQAAAVAVPSETKVIEKRLLTENIDDMPGLVNNAAMVLTPETGDDEDFDLFVNKALENKDANLDIETEEFEKFLDENMHDMEREPLPGDGKMNGLDNVMQDNPIELFENENDIVEDVVVEETASPLADTAEEMLEILEDNTEEENDVEDVVEEEPIEDVEEDSDDDIDDNFEAEMETLREMLGEKDYDMDITSEDLEKYLNFESDIVEETADDVDTEMPNDEINTDLVEAVKTKNAEIDRLGAELLAVKAALEEERKNNELKVRDLEASISAVTEEKEKQIQKKTQSMEDSKKSFRAEIDKLKKELKASNEEKATLQKSAEDAQNEVAVLQKSADDAIKAAAALQKSADKAQNEVAALKKDVKAAKAENKVLSDAAKEIENLKASYKTEVDSLKKSHKSEVDGLKVELAEALKETEDVKAKNLSFKNDIETCKKQIVELENHLKRTVEANEKNKETFILMSGDLAKSKEEIESLQKIDKRYEDLYSHYMATLDFLVSNNLVSKEASEREQRAFKK